MDNKSEINKKSCYFSKENIPQLNNSFSEFMNSYNYDWYRNNTNQTFFNGMTYNSNLYSPKEGFIAMFTSKDALETFQDEFDYQTIVDTYSTRNVKRIKVKRMY